MEEEKLEEAEVILSTNQKEFDELSDRYKRLLAEFENFKKRSSKERESLYNSLISDIVASMLPVLDNLEKAVEVKTEDEGYKQGLELVLKQFKDVLSNYGVKEIEAVGIKFNPEYHEAVSTAQDSELGEKIVKEVLRKGYKIGEKVIRYAMVVVAN
ncbi:MAG: nucleotide exchange factor GrpE [Lachnospiraceae bacterium]|jgi:molecular chaperone GrpE|nr:nucleotide exchange factor GrpE [Lachnospiraceae bacterium]